MHKLAHPDGEAATSRAAASQNLCMGLSVFSTCALEDVIAESNGNPYFMHISMIKDKEACKSTIKRAEGKFLSFSRTKGSWWWKGRC